jgi:hypothetical protein
MRCSIRRNSISRDGVWIIGSGRVKKAARMRVGLLGCLAVAPLLQAQRVQVFSEFRRVGPDGQIVEQDRPGHPREIISPAVPRNGFASFRLVLSPPPGKPFVLHIGQNPDDLLQITLYRELAVKQGTRWIPDKLERASLPVTAFVPLPGAGQPETTSLTYWMDIWVPAHTPVRRIRVEAQLNVGDDWIIYPMEVRVQAAEIPNAVLTTGALPPLTATSAEAAFGPLQSFLCGKNEKPVSSNGPTVRELIRRNASQDLALARRLEPAVGRATLEASISGILGVPDAKSWCEAKGPGGKIDPEVYLKIRDFLMRTSVK